MNDRRKVQIRLFWFWSIILRICLSEINVKVRSVLFDIRLRKPGGGFCGVIFVPHFWAQKKRFSKNSVIFCEKKKTLFCSVKGVYQSQILSQQWGFFQSSLLILCTVGIMSPSFLRNWFWCFYGLQFGSRCKASYDTTMHCHQIDCSIQCFILIFVKINVIFGKITCRIFLISLFIALLCILCLFFVCFCGDMQIGWLRGTL